MRPSTDLRSRAAAVPNSQSCVVVIDDDDGFRESLGRLLRAAGVNPRLFASIKDFVGSDPPDSPTCLVLDVRLPERSGLDFQRDLAAAGVTLPIVFVTGHGDIPMSVQAMKSGAIEFLTKPLREQDLLDAINVGLARDRVRRQNDEALSELRARFEMLTAARARCSGSGCGGSAKQADCRRVGHHRNHGEGPSLQHDAEDRSHIGTTTLPNGG